MNTAPVLVEGDLVTLVSPAGPTRAERVARGIDLLTGWGLRVEVAPHAYGRNGYFSGTDGDRLTDLNTALADPRVKGVFCTRGGYGVQRIVDRVVLGEPKVVVGFSDITALQLALWRTGRLATVHGPGAAWLDERTPEASAASLRDAVMSTAPVVLRRDPAEETAPVTVPGEPVTGVLLGGNLSLLASSVGTGDLPDLTGAVLLVEDVGEAPYRIDRMLTHLRRAGVLDGVVGVAVGQFTDCGDRGDVTVVDVLRDRLGDLGVPVLGGLPVGHGVGQLTVPVGTTATLDVSAGTLTAAAAVH